MPAQCFPALTGGQYYIHGDFMYTVYTIPGSCSTGIVVLLEKLQVEYKAVKRSDVENYSEIVPTNQVPALQLPDGQIITEGAAIALYLMEKHNSPMLPTDLAKKAEFLRWMMFDYATLHPAYGRLFAIQYRVPISDEDKPAAMKPLAEIVANLWAILDRELEKKPFITGDQPTIVDYLAAVYSSWGKNFRDISIPLGKNVERMIQQVSSLPEFQAAYKKENVEFTRK